MIAAHIARSLLSICIGIALLASLILFVPTPFLLLAAVVILPIESALVALAFTPRKTTDPVARTSFGL